MRALRWCPELTEGLLASRIAVSLLSPSSFLRDFAAPLMEKIPRINTFHKTPDREWFETDAVLRVSLGNFLFFTILAIMMVGVKSQRDPHDGIHHGGWMMKIISWCLLVIFMFFLPNEVISFYESISKFGSGFFLLIQVVLLLDFVHGWNDKWVGYDEPFSYIALLVASLVCYVAAFSLSGLLFHFFTPSGQDCGLNLFFIVMTLILVIIFAIIALHPTLYRSTACTSVTVHLPVNRGTMHAMVSTSTQRPFRQAPLLSDFLLLSCRWFILLAELDLYVFALPTKLTSCRRSWKASAFTRQGRRVAGGRERKVHSGNVFLLFLPHHLLPHEHVLRDASDRVVGLHRREREAGGCWLASVWVRVLTGWPTAALFIWFLIAPIMFPDREF